jgi:hypothetical protein
LYKASLSNVGRLRTWISIITDVRLLSFAITSK